MLIAMATYITEENRKLEVAKRCVNRTIQSFDPQQHRMFIVDNASYQPWQEHLSTLPAYIRVIRNDENVGTAKAINKAWKLRRQGENCVKMDDDVVIFSDEWADVLEDVFRRDPMIGICGLKRKDLAEAPWETGWMRSALKMLPHQPGQRWLVIEEVNHVMGTCQAYRSSLLDEMGYLYQLPGNKYGFDDAISAARSIKLGYKNCFVLGITIDHIDPGGTPYQNWKEQNAAQRIDEYQAFVAKITSGEEPVYRSAE